MIDENISEEDLLKVMKPKRRRSRPFDAEGITEAPTSTPEAKPAAKPPAKPEPETKK